MRFDVTVHLDLRQIRFANRAMLERLAKRLIRMMHLRIERGIGTNGQPMAPYSAGYRLRRLASGREGSRRTLTWSGRMKGARGIKSGTNKSVLVGWMAGADAIKAELNERRTPFVQPTRAEINEVVRLLRAEIDALIAAQH